MRNVRYVLAATVTVGATVLAGLAAVPANGAPGAGQATSRSTYLVTVAPGVSNGAAEQALVAVGGNVTARWTHALQGFAVELPDVAAAGLAHNPNFDTIEADGIAYATDVQSNPPSWGLDRIDDMTGLDNSYVYSNGGSGVDVYVIDTGIYAGHVEFAGRVGASKNFVAKGRSVNPNDWNDCNGHGTHVAGTIGGSSTGVAKLVTLHAARVLNCQGSGSWSGVISGIDWVAGQAAGKTAVANMSLGGGFSSTVNSAVKGAVQAGVVMAVAAGNENTDACSKSPASEPSAVTVGATTSTDERASYSNFGSCVDIFAPGSSIYSSWNDGGYNTISGTSMATPHVAGAAARYVGMVHAGASGSWPTPNEVAGALGAGTLFHVAYAASAQDGLLNTMFMDSTSGGGGGTEPSNSAPVVTITKPTGDVSVVAGSTVDFAATAADAGADVSSSIVWRDTSTNVALGTGPSVSVVLQLGTHEVTASATDAGQLTGSAKVTVTVVAGATATAPEAPKSVAVSVNRGRTQVSWVDGADGGSVVTSYQVRFNDLGWIDVGLSNPANFKGLAKGTTYVAYVRACNSIGCGEGTGSLPFTA